MRKAMVWMAGCLGLGLLLMACESSTGSGTDADVVGTWKITSAHDKGWRLDDDGNKQDVDEDDSSQIGGTRQFNADHTLAFDVGFQVTGTWSVSGNTLTTLITVFGFTDTSTSTVTIDGKEGTFVSHDVDAETDIVTTLKATKQ
jgi:hypothetical protein